MSAKAKGIAAAVVLAAVWAIPGNALAARFISGPPPFSNSPDATFEWRSGGGLVVGHECRIDGTRVGCQPPTTTLRGLPDGEHVFTIQDQGLFTDGPVSWRWTIDTRPPETSFGATPPAYGESREARFELRSNEQGVRFECRFEGQPFSACDATVTRTVDYGLHTFEARAIDRAGNVDPTPARYSWFVAPPTPPDLGGVGGGSGPGTGGSNGSGSSGSVGGGPGSVLLRPPEATLRVIGSRTVRQGRALRVDAAGSRATAARIVIYRFEWGDGTADTTYQPRAIHAYRRPGTYRVRVTVIDALGLRATSDTVRVLVIDGEPPAVAVTSPLPGGRLRMGRTGVRLSGTATDRSGVRTVELAMHLVATAGFRQQAGAPLCAWYDGSRGFKVRSCAQPVWFRAVVRKGRWSFTIPRSARIFAGTWVLRIRARDRLGNVADDFSLRKRTLVPFELLPYRR